jgi:peptide deformylase
MRIKIANVGEAVLRTEAQTLIREEILSARIHELINHMRETLADAPGVGVSAPHFVEDSDNIFRT